MDFENSNYIEHPEYYPISPYQSNKFDAWEGKFKNNLQQLIANKASDADILKEISEGSNIYQRSDSNLSSLCLAISNRMENVIEKLLKIYAGDVKTLKEHGWNCRDSSVLIAYGKSQIDKISNKLPSNLPSRELPEKKIFILCKENNETPVDVKILIQEDEADAKIALEIIESLFDNGTVDILYKSFMGNSVLHLAAFEGFQNVLETFIEFGEDFNLRNNKNVTPFGYACMNNRLETVKYFHKQLNVEILETLTSHKEIVFGMAANGSWETFDYLMNEIRRFSDEEHLQKIFSLKTEFHEINFLYIAILNRKFDFVKKCLDYNPDITRVDRYGENILHCAIKVPNARDFIKFLMSNYPFLISSEDNCTITPLHLLAIRGYFEEFVEMYQKFPELKLNFFKASENIEHVLRSSIVNGHFKVAIFLLENHETTFDSKELLAKMLGIAIVKPDSLELIKKIQKFKNFDINVPGYDEKFALIEALKAGQTENFQFLIDNCNIKNYNLFVDPIEQGNLLYYAIYSRPDGTKDELEIGKYFEIFNFLVLKEIDYKKKTVNGRNLLHRAVFFNKIKIATILLNLGLEATSTDNEGKTALHFVKSPEVLKVLMEHNSTEIINIQDGKGQTPIYDLMTQCKPNCEDVQLLEELLKLKPNLKIQDKNGFTYLHLAANVECAKLLIDQGADVNALNNFGENVLFKTAGRDYYGLGPFPELAKYYLKNTEVDPFIVNKNGVSILGCNVAHPIDYEEVFRGHYEIFQELLNKYKNSDGTNGDRILQSSFYKDDDFSLTLKLLELKDIDVKFKNVDNSTMLHKLSFGLSNNAIRVAKILVEKGVDVNEPNDSGKTPLILSIENLDVRKALFLMDLPQVQLNSQDFNGNTALHAAAAVQGIQLICALLLRGADPTTLNNDHKHFYDRLNEFNKSLFYFYAN